MSVAGPKTAGVGRCPDPELLSSNEKNVNSDIQPFAYRYVRSVANSLSTISMGSLIRWYFKFTTSL